MSKSKHKHLSLEDRTSILLGIKEGLSIRKIALTINCSPSTISRELKNHRYTKSPNNFNNCADRSACKSNRLYKAPWICPGCNNFIHCRKLKYLYDPAKADNQYKQTLIFSRSGTHCNADAFDYLNKLITPAIKKQSQTLGHIYSYLADTIGISRSTLYRYIDKGYLEVKNIDLPKRVKYKAERRKKSTTAKEYVNRKGRTYLDFLTFCDKKPKASVYELDTVIGKKGDNEKVILTILLRKSNFMMAFLRDKNDSKSVVDIFDYLESKLGKARFMTLFYVGLTDNGSEFSSINELESRDRKVQRTNIFYCDPRQSQQKGKIEKNHEYIRKFFPQGTSFNSLTQKDLDSMMNNINSAKRESLGNLSPFECLTKSQLISINKLGYRETNPKKVILNISLFKKI